MITREEKRERIRELAALKKILDAIELTDSFVKKRAIILANIEDDLLIKTLFFLICRRKTGIKEQKLLKKVYFGNDKIGVLSWPQLIDYLEKNNNGRDQDIVVVQKFLNSYPKKMEPYLIRLILKKLNLKVSKNTLDEITNRRE